jgi:hypothetical protein
MKAILPENLSNAEKEKKNKIISNIETWPDSQAMLPVPGNAFGNEFKKHQDRSPGPPGTLLNVPFSFTHSHKENSAQEHRF